MFGCSQFPTRYDRIEPNKIRNIGVTLKPQAEGAPGDTIHARAYWGGEPVTSVTWQISYDCIRTLSGETILNTKPLQTINVVNRLPDSIDFSFVIPDSVFFKTPAISSEGLAMAQSTLPPGMRSMTQADCAAFLTDLGAEDLADPASLGSFVSKWGPAMGISTISPTSMDTIMSVAGMLMHVFSIRGVLYGIATSTTGNRLKIKGEFAIRYNNRVKGTLFEPMFPVNRNPAVRWIGVYKIKNTNGQAATPTLTANDSLTYLYNEFMPWKAHDTVLIEKGYTYYLAADSGTVAFSLKAGDSLLQNSVVQIFPSDTTFFGDTVLDNRLIGIDSGTNHPVVDAETYTYDWQYQNLAISTVTMPLDSLFVIVGAGQGGGQPPVMQFLPSLDKKMTCARIWVTVSDFLYGDFNRPTGQTTRVVDLNFKYAE